MESDSAAWKENDRYAVWPGCEPNSNKGHCVLGMSKLYVQTDLRDCMYGNNPVNQVGKDTHLGVSL